MQRILIVGSGGSGKSTLAFELGALLYLPVIHLDSYYWMPDWKAAPSSIFRSSVETLVREPTWIIEGGTLSSMRIALPRCDAVILLQFPRFICLVRVFWRSVMYYGKSRPDLPEGYPERIPPMNVCTWVWNYPKAQLPAIVRSLRGYEGRGKKIFVLQTRSQVRAFLSVLRQSGSMP